MRGLLMTTSVAKSLIAYTAAAGLLTITPGLDTALVLRTAVVEGPRRAMLAGLGICAGVFSWAIAASVGLGVLLTVSRAAYSLLRFLGGAYLIFLGVIIFLRGRSQASITEAVSRSALNSSGLKPTSNWFLRGLLTNLLNPKVGVFYVTFLPQFIPQGTNVVLFGLLLAGIHVTEGMLWFLLLVSGTRLISGWIQRPAVTRALDCATGTVLVGFGIRLMWEKQR
jgi:threonine/homoserine/homoserine lactone efflux protein